MKIPKLRSNTPSSRQSLRTLTVLAGDRHLVWPAEGKGISQKKNIRQISLSGCRLGGECLNHRLNLIVVTQFKNEVVLSVRNKLEELRQ